MKISNALLKKLPKTTGHDETAMQMEYVKSVLAGKSKNEAFREHFPDKYDEAIDKANGDKKFTQTCISLAISRMDNRSAVKQMYALANKHQWTNFLVKKNIIMNNSFDMATNEDNSIRDRISASKLWLENVPKFEEDKTIVVEVKDGKQEFIDKLREMQIALHKQANKDAIDTEVIDDRPDN